MRNRDFTINTFMTRGIIEANIEFAQTHQIPLCVVKFEYQVDIEDTFFFKDLISFIHTYSDFNSILQQPHDTFLIFLRDCKIHQAKSIMASMLNKIKNKFKIDIAHVGITLLDAKDDYKKLLDRLDKYFVMSKISSKKKVFYGTADFDFYESQSDKKVLENIFKKLGSVTLFNFYQGLPITEPVKVLKFDQSLVQINIDPIKLAFYEREKFTFIQHDLIPNIIKASIIKIDNLRSLLVLGNLEFLDSSPVERNGLRVEPERNVYVSVSVGNKKVIDGNIVSISEDAVVIHADIDKVSVFVEKSLWNTDLTLQFQIATQKSFLVPINTKAMLYSIVNEKIVLNISPNTPTRSKIRAYLAKKKSEVLEDFKETLKKNR